MNHDKKIFLNTFYQVAGKILTSFLGLLVTAIITRYFSKNTFGEYSLAFTIANFAFIFADFGLAALLIREIAAKRKDLFYIAESFTFRLFLSVGILIVTNIAVQFLPYSQTVKIGVAIASFGSFFLLLSSIIWAVFQAELRFDKLTIAQVSTSIVNFILVVFALLSKLAMLDFIFFSSLSTAIGFLLSLRFLPYKGKLLAVHIPSLKRIFLDVWPFGISLIVSTGYFKVDSLILSYYYNPASSYDFSYYTIAYKAFEVMTVFGGFFVQALYPYICKIIDTKHFVQDFFRYSIYTCGIASIGFLLLFVFAKPIIFVLGPTTYAPAIPSLQILSLGAAITVLGGYFSSIAAAANKQYRLLQFSVAAFILNVVINLFIIPRYSFIGASWITVLTQGFIMITSLYIVIKKLRQNANEY